MIHGTRATVVRGTDTPAKVCELQKLVHTRSAHAFSPAVLFEGAVPQTEQNGKSTSLARETGEPKLLARSRAR
jgi:hypothetical protein